MSSERMMKCRVVVEGFPRQDYIVSSRLLRLYFEDAKDVFDQNGVTPDGIIVAGVTIRDPDVRLAWRSFFQYIHSGDFTIPELIPTAAGRGIGARDGNLWHIEHELLQAYDLASRYDMADYKNKIMDGLYELGCLGQYPCPVAMANSLGRLDPDSMMQAYFAAVITVMLLCGKMEVHEYAILGRAFPNLKSDVDGTFAECELYDRHLPAREARVHVHWGPCAFHEHEDEEQCYLEDGCQPRDQTDDQARSEDEVEMEDRGTQTDDYLASDSDELTSNAMEEESETQTDEEMDGDETYEANIRSDVAEISSDDSEEDIPAVIRKKCRCSENERRHIAHRCR